MTAQVLHVLTCFRLLRNFNNNPNNHLIKSFHPPFRNGGHFTKNREHFLKNEDKLRLSVDRERIKIIEESPLKNLAGVHII